MTVIPGTMSSSPTPSLDSLPPLGPLLDESSPQCGSGSSSSSSSTSGLLNGGVMPIGSLPNGSHPGSHMLQQNGINGIANNNNLKCGICRDTYTLPRVLPCLHTFCQHCIERAQDTPDHVYCPQCRHDCPLPLEGPSGLMLDYAISSLLDAAALEQSGGISGLASGQINLPCTGCKSRDSGAVARCFDCANFLCGHCVMAHQFMHCFEGHHFVPLGELQNGKVDGFSKNGNGLSEAAAFLKSAWCPRHKGEQLQQFCRACVMPACRECAIEHSKPNHELEPLEQAGPRLFEQMEKMNRQIEVARIRTTELRQAAKTAEAAASLTQFQAQEAEREVQEAFQMFQNALEERRVELSREIEAVASAKQISLSVNGQRALESSEKLQQTCHYGERLLRHASPAEVLLSKKLIETRLQMLLSPGGGCGSDIISLLVTPATLEFVPNLSPIQSAIRTVGFLRTGESMQMKQPPIARPQHTPGIHMNGASSPLGNGNHMGMDRHHNNHHTNGHMSSYESNMLTKRFPFQNASINELAAMNGLNGSSYEKWSAGEGNGLFHNGDSLLNLGTNGINDSVADLAAKFSMVGPLFPPKSQLKRQKMIYHCKFGEFGVLEGQFTEPSGVAVNAQNDIIVADTNNHRIQVFDREGRFKFQFGECGKRDGQLLYPNRVAVVKPSGDIIVTERSPTHQIQIYNQYGQFVRKFGATILQHPRGVTVDNKGRIVVVECKVMRVLIFDQLGNVLQKFGCSKHLEFPNGVVVNDRQEIFISDNRAHCVKVFNYDGAFLRQIGGEGLTNYPIGVGINAAGEILIADNHNNFNLTIFSQDGQLVAAMESKVKHAQCFDVALLDDGSVVLASKDYRLYVYRYAQATPISL